jgi:hypothetical protein
MVSIFRAHSPISFEHMSIGCPFLDPHLITHHSKHSCPNYCRGGIWHFYLSTKMNGMMSSTMTSSGALSLGNKTPKFDMRDGMVRLSDFVGISILIGFKGGALSPAIHDHAMA